VVRVAHAVGVSVEAELGSVGGAYTGIDGTDSTAETEHGDPERYFTDPDLAAQFVERTGTDALAISFGNVHGLYRGEPRLDLQRVRKIHAMTDVPLAVHGASGLEEGDYRRIVESGISKLNYYTVMGIDASADLRRMFADAGQDVVVYHQIISWAIDFFYADTKRLMDVVQCSGVIK